MWRTNKLETFLYLVLGLYIATPSKINIFYRLINHFSQDASRTTIEVFVFVKLFISIIGAIIVISAVMDLYDKIRQNEFA